MSSNNISISITDVRPATANEWDLNWEECDYATYFHSREWAEIWNVYTKSNICTEPTLVLFSDGKNSLLPLSSQKVFKGLMKNYLSAITETFRGLIYESIKDACEQGYSGFDFNPSGGHEGVKEFKKRFGTEELPCPVLENKSPFLSTLNQVRCSLSRH